MEGLGLSPDDIPATEVFEENIPAFDLLCYMATQWSMGPGGAVGLKYEVAHHKLDRAKLEPDEYESRMDDLRVMEQVVLEVMRDQRKEK